MQLTYTPIEYPLFNIQREGRVVHLEFKHGSLDRWLYSTLLQYRVVLGRLETLCDCLIISAEGPNFSHQPEDPGAFRRVEGLVVELVEEPVTEGAIERATSTLLLQLCVTLAEKLSIPTISVAQGNCGGVALAIVASTSIRLCTNDVAFRIGQCLLTNGQLLTRLAALIHNQSTLFELALTRREIDAHEASKIGLVGTVITDKARALKRAKAMAKEITANGAGYVRQTQAHLKQVPFGSWKVQEGCFE